MRQSLKRVTGELNIATERCKKKAGALPNSVHELSQPVENQLIQEYSLSR